MFNVAIYWVNLGNNGIFYSLSGTESKVFVLISKVVKHKQEEFSGRPICMYVYVISHCVYMCMCVRV